MLRFVIPVGGHAAPGRRFHRLGTLLALDRV